MPRINALNILLESDGKEYLAELYGKTIEGVQKALISGSMKNMDLSGDPVSGTVEAKRFVNATPKNYGTARTAGKGDAVKAKPVTVAIDTDREIVEELEQKDVRLYGVDGVLDRRSANHILRMAAELDNAFFAAAAGKATVLNLSAYKTISDELEAIIQECETTQNDFVDGVPRSMMHLVLSPKYYGMIRNDLDKQTNNANVTPPPRSSLCGTASARTAASTFPLAVTTCSWSRALLLSPSWPTSTPPRRSLSPMPTASSCSTTTAPPLSCLT